MKRRFLIPAVMLVALAVAAPAAEAHTLGYVQAKRAAKKKADRFSGERTRVTTLFRQGRHRYYAQAEWDQGSQQCFAEFTVRFRSRRSRRVVARIIGSYC